MKTQANRVGDVLELVRQPVDIDPNILYRYIGIRSFGNGVICYPSTRGAELSKLRYFRLPPDALLLSNIKAWEGAIAVSPQNETEFVASNRFLSYTPKDKNRVDVGYLKYFFLSPRGLPLVQRASPGAADRNRTLGIKAFEDIRIPLPHIDKQQQISAQLDRLHERRLIAKTKAKQARTIVAALHDLLCRVDGTGTRVGDVLELVRKPADIDPVDEYRQIGIYSFGKGIIEREPIKGADLSKLRYFTVPASALVLSNIQAWEGAIATSTNQHSDFVASNRFLSYIPKHPGVDVNYLRYFFLSERGHPHIQKASPGTMVRNRTLGIKAFEDIRIALPHADEQRQIASQLDRAYEVLRRIEGREKLFDSLVKSALNRAFNDLG